MASSNLPQVAYTEGDLTQRMAFFKVGQVSWPVLGCGFKCTDCRHYAKADAGKGRCVLVKKTTRKPGALFFGAEAIGCSKFEARA